MDRRTRQRLANQLERDLTAQFLAASPVEEGQLRKRGEYLLRVVGFLDPKGTGDRSVCVVEAPEDDDRRFVLPTAEVATYTLVGEAR